MMRTPTYTLERVKLADCYPHVDAEAYSASNEDRKALANSIKESGVLSPIAVIRAENGGGAERSPRPTDGRAGAPSPAAQYLVIDGIGRMEAMREAGIDETDAQVFDLGDLSVPEFVVCKNAMMRKVTTGTRVMAYLKCHEREVLAAADPERYSARGRDEKGRITKPAQSYDRTGDDKRWSSRDIAERIGVSDKDVLAGIELLKASSETVEDDEASESGRDGARPSHLTQMDLFETVESVLRGETPIRRWKACAGGKVSTVGGKAAADYTNIALRTVKSWRTIFQNWQTVPMEMRQVILDEFRDAISYIPDDMRHVFELVICKGKKRRR